MGRRPLGARAGALGLETEAGDGRADESDVSGTGEDANELLLLLLLLPVAPGCTPSPPAVWPPESVEVEGLVVSVGGGSAECAGLGSGETRIVGGGIGAWEGGMVVCATQTRVTASPSPLGIGTRHRSSSASETCRGCADDNRRHKPRWFHGDDAHDRPTTDVDVDVDADADADADVAMGRGVGAVVSRWGRLVARSARTFAIGATNPWPPTTTFNRNAMETCHPLSLRRGLGRSAPVQCCRCRPVFGRGTVAPKSLGQRESSSKQQSAEACASTKGSTRHARLPTILSPRLPRLTR